MVVSNIRSAQRFKQTVLIIDDQPTVLSIHTAIIKSLKMNLNIVALSDPIEALEWVRYKQVDLVITDFSMMKMNGIEFIQTINHSNFVGPRPIIVITALKNKQTHQELIAAGAAACFTKPVNPAGLASMARFLLQRAKQFYQVEQAALN